jgi:tRNA pseudouridine65 synthase
MLDIVYQDEHLIAINKPHGLMVHRSSIAADVEEFAIQLLRDQIGQKVYPCHRIDRKTAGVLLFALDKHTEITMQRQFMNNEVKKRYLAVVRGFTDEGVIDYPLRKENGTLQDAITNYKTLKRTELDVPFGSHPTSRYSLVEVEPQTGRMHQIRKHLSHIFHPIIGDRTHGCNKQNKLFTDRWEMNTMLLHAAELNFVHPITTILTVINAPLQPEFINAMELLRL